MAKRTSKVTKKDIPVIKGDLKIDPAILAKVKNAQDVFSRRFSNEIKAVRTDALKRYTNKINSLKKEKVEMLKKYNADIKKYEKLVKELKVVGKKTIPKKTNPKTAVSKKKTTK